MLPVYAGLSFAGIGGQVTFLSANNVSVWAMSDVVDQGRARPGQS